MKKIILFFLIISFNIAIAENDFYDENDYDFIFSELNFKLRKPFIDLNFGNNNNSIDKSIINNNILNNGNFEAKFGFDRVKKLFKELNVLKGSNSYLSVEGINNSLNMLDKDKSGINYDSWRISLGNDNFYGYSLNDNINMLFSDGGSLGLIWLKFNNFVTDSLEKDYLNYLSDGARWSKEVENNIKLFYNNVGLNVGYSRTVIFTRMMFWSFAGSELLYQIGDGTINWFVKTISKSSPYAAPIIYLVLKSAYNYAIFELRKGDMNWPFDTAKPLIYDNFKIGLSFRF